MGSLQLDSFANTNKDQLPPRVPMDLRADLAGMQDTKWNCTTIGLREMHGYSMWRNDIPGDPLNGHEYVALQSWTGFQLWDFTDPTHPDMVKDVVLNYTDYDISAATTRTAPGG